LAERYPGKVEVVGFESHLQLSLSRFRSSLDRVVRHPHIRRCAMQKSASRTTIVAREVVERQAGLLGQHSVEARALRIAQSMDGATIFVRRGDTLSVARIRSYLLEPEGPAH
jgi:hypothetical protein